MGVFWGGGRALVSTDALTAPVAGSHAHPAAPSSGCPRPPPAADTAARDQRRLNADAAHPVTTIRCVLYATAKAAATASRPGVCWSPSRSRQKSTRTTRRPTLPAGPAPGHVGFAPASPAHAPPVFVLDGIDVVRTGKGLQLVTLPTSVGDFEMEDSDGRFEYWRANMVDVDEDFVVTRICNSSGVRAHETTRQAVEECSWAGGRPQSTGPRPRSRCCLNCSTLLSLPSTAQRQLQPAHPRWLCVLNNAVTQCHRELP